MLSDRLWVSVWIILMQENQTSTHCTGNRAGSHLWISWGEGQRKRLDLVPRLLTSNQNHLINLFFSTREYSLYSGKKSKKRQIPLEGNLHLQWLCLPSGEAHLWSLATGEAWWNPYHTHISEKLLPLPLEDISVSTGGVCCGRRLKDWACSDAQSELIISVHWRAGESSNAVLSSLLPMPRPIKYPCGIWETPMGDFPLLDGTWTCFSQRNVQTKLSKPLPDYETFKDVPICIK